MGTSRVHWLVGLPQPSYDNCWSMSDWFKSPRGFDPLSVWERDLGRQYGTLLLRYHSVIYQRRVPALPAVRHLALSLSVALLPTVPTTDSLVRASRV